MQKEAGAGRDAVRRSSCMLKHWAQEQAPCAGAGAC